MEHSKPTETKPSSITLLPPDIVAVGHPNPRMGTLQLARLERAGRGIAAVRTLCDLPVQPYWTVQEIREAGICRDCLAKVVPAKA